MTDLKERARRHMLEEWGWDEGGAEAFHEDVADFAELIRKETCRDLAKRLKALKIPKHTELHREVVALIEELEDGEV